ncbi:MAG: methylmalonyl-CoA epimerase [Candidatus Eisenbacteria bacterium]|uniref:Methylmalonyl-CoA epimerase n=1 Tax=Eiseniibacteriota bacterium TaxID=2212470 RepID=A0A538TPV9_UNCEI|nr:MAG: methylmalonyl-CoA epimerase [Candidatus Eisenbacteria bacterium]
MLGLAHIGLAVTSIEAASARWKKLGFRVTGTEMLESMHVKIVFMESGGSTIELLEPTKVDSPIGRFLAKRGEGIHHVAFHVPDLEAALSAAGAQGLELIDRTPRDGSHGMKIAFLHPRSMGGVLVELCERT